MQVLRLYGAVPVRLLAQVLQCGEKSTQTMLDDMRAFGVVELEKNEAEGGRTEACLSDKAMGYLRAGWKDIETRQLNS